MIKNNGGIFGRNPTFNNVEVEGDLTVDGSIIGTIVVDANTLTGTTLAANVVDSSLTSVGTLEFLTVINTIGGNISGNAASATVATSANSALTANTANTATSALTAATVTTPAQPTITSVGTLTSITTSSDITFSTIDGDSVFGLGNGFDKLNVALGSGSLASCTPDGTTGDGEYNLAIGAGSLYSITLGSFNTAIGTNALAYGQTCSYNTAIGESAMGGNYLSPQIGNGYNIGIGYSSCNALTTNTNVIGIGKNSFLSLGTGNNSVAIGQAAGQYAINTSTALTNTTNSIYIGGNTKASAASGNTNEIVIGQSALGIGSNTTVIGNSSTLANKIFGVQATGEVAPTIASATTIAPTKQITFVSGIAPIVTITAPTGIATTGGQITIIPTGMFTTTIAGNIALASTAVISKALIMTYDAGIGKWYPSY